MKREILLLIGFALVGCQGYDKSGVEGDIGVRNRLEKYSTVKLTSDLSALTEKERQMIPLLIEAAGAMDEIFWMQAYGDKEALLASVHDPDVRRFVEINYGPWDRLEGNEPFIEGVGSKPLGANF